MTSTSITVLFQWVAGDTPQCHYFESSKALRQMENPFVWQPVTTKNKRLILWRSVRKIHRLSDDCAWRKRHKAIILTPTVISLVCPSSYILSSYSSRPVQWDIQQVNLITKQMVMSPGLPVFGNSTYFSNIKLQMFLEDRPWDLRSSIRQQSWRWGLFDSDFCTNTCRHTQAASL